MTSLLALDEAAAKLGGISRRTLEREIADGKIAVVEIRGRVMIDAADVPEYIARSKSLRKPQCPSDQRTVFIEGPQSKRE